MKTLWCAETQKKFLEMANERFHTKDEWMIVSPEEGGMKLKNWKTGKILSGKVIFENEMWRYVV